MTVSLRRAEASDCGLLFSWVNLPDSLAGKLRTRGPIARAEHDAWFQQRLADADCRLWIVMTEGHPQGQIRLTRSPEGWEIDIYVASAARRRGVARDALAQAIEALRTEVPGAPLLARVKPDNAASRRLFERLGFRATRQSPDYVAFVL